MRFDEPGTGKSQDAENLDDFQQGAQVQVQVRVQVHYAWTCVECSVSGQNVQKVWAGIIGVPVPPSGAAREKIATIAAG
jgi:hypothetical protein